MGCRIVHIYIHTSMAVPTPYNTTGKMLRTYTAGKLPKAFKILPALANWEEVVYLTRPDEWTPHVSCWVFKNGGRGLLYVESWVGWLVGCFRKPGNRSPPPHTHHTKHPTSRPTTHDHQATYVATRIFASNLNAKLSQRFFNLILLEKCRDDIHANKNLNYHYYMGTDQIDRSRFIRPHSLLTFHTQSPTRSTNHSAQEGHVQARRLLQGHPPAPPPVGRLHHPGGHHRRLRARQGLHPGTNPMHSLRVNQPRDQRRDPASHPSVNPINSFPTHPSHTQAR